MIARGVISYRSKDVCFIYALVHWACTTLNCFSFSRFPVKTFLTASKPRFFNAYNKVTPLILSLATPKAVDATAFPILGHNVNKQLAKLLNSLPTPYPFCIIVPEYTGIPLPLCKHATYFSHVGKYTISAIFLFKV